MAELGLGFLPTPPSLSLSLCRGSKWSTTTPVCEQTSFNKRNGYIKVISSNLPAASLLPRHWSGAAVRRRQSANKGNLFPSTFCSVSRPDFPFHPFHCFLISFSLAAVVVCNARSTLFAQQPSERNVVRRAHVYVKLWLLLECLDCLDCSE